MPSSAVAYEAARDSGLLSLLIGQNLLLPSDEQDASSLEHLTPKPAYVLEHPRIPFISYPYEWSFSLHRRAALHHLDVHLAALENNFTLSDASAYNVQFRGTRPIFIDHLSLIPYQDGDVWIGHRQFCMQFLNPLIFWAVLGVQPNHWFRGSLEGIAPEDLSKLLSWRNNLSWTILTHVTAHAALQTRSVRTGKIAGKPSARRLSKTALIGILRGLRSYMDTLKLPSKSTIWGGYAEHTSYGRQEQAAKHRFVARMVEAVNPQLMFDLGCNSGDYSATALDAGARSVIGFDFDPGALERAYNRFSDRDTFLPLWLDAANPSPSQGWAQAERKGLAERSSVDALVALAFIHHVAIGRNVPLHMAIDWITSLAPVGVVEFPPKSDPMVQKLLAQREDIFQDYDETLFLTHIRTRARVHAQERLSADGRLLVWYDRT
jgi:ribosomal protein L11 methylase PrmA